MKKIQLSISLFALLAMALSAQAIEPAELAKRQARSVHLQFGAIPGGADAIQGTGLVTETQTNTYFCILGWNTGYCGIQDKGEEGNILIFSLWEPSDPFDFKARPEDVNPDIRAQVLYSAPKVDVARFGGEGTGARTITKIDWKVGEPVTVRIEAAPVSAERTAYTCYWQDPKTGSFIKIASISTMHKPVSGCGGIDRPFSFVEDFWRNFHSATISRRAEFSDIAYLPHGKTEWVPLNRAKFTADKTPSNAIDAGLAENGSFFLKTGGATTNTHVKLREMIEGTAEVFSGASEGVKPVTDVSVPDVLTAIATRKSIRKFDPLRVVEDEKIEKILKAAMAAPSAMDKRPWEFVVVKDKAQLKTLGERLPYSRVANGAQLAIIVCGSLDNGISGRGKEYWIHDCSAATMNILLAAHGLGLGAVWTGVYPGEERVAIVREILSIPAGYAPLNVIPIGYPAEDPAVKNKWNPEKLHPDRW